MQEHWETFKVKGEELLGCARELVHEGNVQRIVVQQGDRTIAEFPLTVGVVGALAAPALAAIGGLAVLLTDCTVRVKRAEGPGAAGESPRAARPARKRAVRKRARA